MSQVYENKAVTFTVRIRPDRVELNGLVGADADEEEAFALCELLLAAVRDFSRGDFSPYALK